MAHLEVQMLEAEGQSILRLNEFNLCIYFLIGHTFDLYQTILKARMFLRSETPTVQSSLVDPRRTLS